MADDVEVRFTADLININERERDIIIAWAEQIIQVYGMDNEEQYLRGRFIEWKEQRERQARRNPR